MHADSALSFIKTHLGGGEDKEGAWRLVRLPKRPTPLALNGQTLGKLSEKLFAS